jgi:hypothetical protein
LRRVFNAAVFGLALFMTVFVMALVAGVIVNIIYGFDFSRPSIWILLKLALLAGAKTGFVCFILGLFNVYRKIGSGDER